MRPPLARQTPPPSPAMASLSPSPATVLPRRCKTGSKEALNPSFADLPSSLVEVIMSKLALKDNIRASAACKSWLEAATFVRVMGKYPWLMCLDKHGEVFTLCDPLSWKFHTLKLPELAKSTVCYSRNGWLLMRRSISNDIFFFNPFTRELVSLPKFELSFHSMAFSCPPTSDDCVFMALTLVAGVRQGRIIISTCRPGATEWITEEFPNRLPFYIRSKIVYLDDRFYCFTVGGGYLCSFHPSSRTWVCHDAYVYKQLPSGEWDKRECYLAEKKGELFLVFRRGIEKPWVYKLVSLQWEEVSSTELDGSTCFVSFYNSELRANLPWMSNNVCYSRFGTTRESCVSYSFDESRQSPPKERQDWIQLFPPRSLWIDPPENVLDYL